MRTKHRKLRCHERTGNVESRKKLDFKFAEKHKEYIRNCLTNTYNIAEGAVRAGKTVDNVFAFAHEIKTHPSKLHLATGSTAANAKLNIGDCNGYGLEAIFRGQCHWGKYKGNDCLVIKGPATNHREKVVIFAGAALASSFKKIRGNSYGTWIATEINLHHDNTIKEAFNRTLASPRRKFFWDLNPDHPMSPIYTEYIDKYVNMDKAGTLLGGVNYKQFTIFDNINISKENRDAFISQYEPGSIWYLRDIEGRRSIAEGLIYTKLATSVTAKDKKYVISKEEAQKLARNGKFIKIIVGIDFGGNGSGHSFVAVGITQGFKQLVVLKTRRYLEGEPDPDTDRKVKDIDPEQLGIIFINFLKSVISEYGFVTKIYADSAESVLIRGLRTALLKNNLASIKINDALKSRINDRIFATTALTAADRLRYTEDCKSFENAVSMAVWDPKKIELTRLDDGSSDIDTLDAFEYTFEHDIRKLIKDVKIDREREAG